MNLDQHNSRRADRNGSSCRLPAILPTSNTAEAERMICATLLPDYRKPLPEFTKRLLQFSPESFADPQLGAVAKAIYEVSVAGKNNHVVVYVSDLDPEGIDMPSSWKKYLAFDFGIEATVYRSAVTPEQVETFHLPPDADVKLSSTRARTFIDEHGDECWELDSMPEQDLIDEVSKTVRAVLDIDALNRAFAREREADIELAKLEARVRAFVTDTFRNAA